MSRSESPLRNRVIFLVGVQRSGTNWLQRILAAHPRVAAAPSETYLFSAGLRPLSERFHHGAISSSTTGMVYVDRETLLDSMRHLCDSVFVGLIQGLDPSADYIVERTPDHIHHLDLIADVYPDGQVVHIIRDGRDVVRSLLSQDWGPADARQAARQWRSGVEAARAVASRLSCYHEVRYEDLLAEPEQAISKLFSDLGLQTGPDDLAAALAEAGARYNVDPAAPTVGSGKWKSGLSPAGLDEVLKETGDLLTDLGYEVDQRPNSPATDAPRTPPSKPSGLRGLAGLRRSKKKTAAPDSLADMQTIADRFITRATTDPGSVAGMLSPSARVRITGNHDRFEGRGQEAAGRLVDALTRDEVLRGRQVVGYLHPAIPTFTFIGQFEHDGRLHSRVVALDISGRHINRVAYYDLDPPALRT